MSKKIRKNDELAVLGDVRVIDEHGEMLGVIPVERALALARDRGLDLAEVDGEAEPPICKILDLARFNYSARRADRQRG